MDGLFTTILERGIAASFLVLAVVLLRLVFKKMPKWFRCMLWGLVAFRLVCPFSFESSFSLMPDISRISEVLEESVLQEEEPAATPEEELPPAGQENFNVQEVLSVGNESKDNTADIGNIVDSTTSAGNIADNTTGTGNMVDNVADTDRVQNSSTDTNEENLSGDTQSVSPTEQTVTEPASTEQKFTWQQIQQNPMPYLWLAGAFLMVLYGVVSYFKVKYQVKASWNAKENIFYCDDIDTPFVFGLLKPGIYLPSGIEEATAEYVLRHEKEHLRRGDQWWKLFGFGLLAVYWFHPALWVAYILFCKDIEFACDERVVKELGEEKRREYAQALLQCSIGKRVVLFCPTAFGENSVKGRIRSVMTYKKATIPVLVVAVLACLVVGVLFLTDRKDAYGIEQEHLTLETDALDEKLAERIAEDIAELMVESKEGIYQLDNFRFTFYDLESERGNRLLRVSVEADRTSLREPEDSPVIQGMKKAQSELTYEAERTFAQTMIDSMLLQLKQETEAGICEPAIFITLDEKNNYELYYGDANRTQLKDYFTKENTEQEEFLGYLSVYQRAGIQPPMDVTGSSGYMYVDALENPEKKLSSSDVMMSGMSLLAPSLLYYREGVYESIVKYEEKDAAALPWELLGEEIKTAFSNHGEYWSERDALLECTGGGTLYRVKGYEDTYRVAVVYEQNWRNDDYLELQLLATGTLPERIFQSVIGLAKEEEIQPDKTTYHMIILEHMNGLWFHEGREIFQQRMHLENAVLVNGLSMEEELLWNFVAELNAATFAPVTTRNLVNYETITFTDALGMEHSLQVYEAGYVAVRVCETSLYAKIDEELCRQVMERVEAYRIENFEVSFEHAIPVEAILNQEEGYQETYENICYRANQMIISTDWQFFGEEGYYISRVPIQYYDMAAEALSEEAILILFSRDFSKAAELTIVRNNNDYTILLSDIWNSKIHEELKAHPEEEFIFLYSPLIDPFYSSMPIGELLLDEQNVVRYRYPQGNNLVMENLYQMLYSDALAVSYEELTAEENLIWVQVSEPAEGTSFPTPTPVDTSQRSYQKDYEKNPYAVYTAEEWMKNGRLEVPFSWEDMLLRQQLSERFVMYYIPEEALKAATTADLLHVAWEWPFAEYGIYNFPSYYLDFISEKFNGMDELFRREDFASVLLKEYEATGFYMPSGRPIGTSEEEYKKAAAKQENAIVLMEILLATNAVFEQMTSTERLRTLEAVANKMMLRKSGLFLADEKVSGFFASVKENSLLGNKWYEYIVNGNEKEWLAFVENVAYPMDHVQVQAWEPTPIPTPTEAPEESADEVLKTLRLPLLGKEHTLEVIGRKRNDYDIYGVREIKVYVGSDLVQSVLMQEAIEADGVGDSGYTECPSAEETVALRDVNFDGYLDLEVWGWMPNNSIPYYYWCWNPETQQFDYAFCLQLTDIDEERKQLISYQKVGGGVYYTERYRVTASNTLELAERMTEDYRTFNSWQDAYLDVIYSFPDNLIDPYDFHDDSDWTNPEKYIYLGIHDFDLDGTPELIVGDGASLAVFTYKNGKVEKSIDIVMQCCWRCIDDVAFHDNAILTSCWGSDGGGHTAVVYQNGAWITAVYCDYHPQKISINGESATYEEFCGVVPFDPKDYHGTIKPYGMRDDYMSVVVTEENETFDFELIRWTED